MLFDTGEYDPGLQVVQVVTPDLGEKVPARHSLQVPLTGQTDTFQSVGYTHGICTSLQLKVQLTCRGKVGSSGTRLARGDS